MLLAQWKTPSQFFLVPHPLGCTAAAAGFCGARAWVRGGAYGEVHVVPGECLTQDARDVHFIL